MSKSDLNAVVDLAKYMDQKVRIKFQGGREIDGVLKGFDKLDNLVLDECIEFIRDVNDPTRVTDETRVLGLVVCRGTQICLLSPSNEMEEIANPFTEFEEDINVEN